MSSNTELMVLGADGLGRFQALQAEAINTVTERFYAAHGSVYEKFGQRGRDACREDLAFHLEFLRPVLEFGILQPMVDYLCWLAGVLKARAIPTEHLAQSLDWLSEFFAGHLESSDSAVIAAALHGARTRFLQTGSVPPVPLKSPDAWPEAAPFSAALLAGDQRTALNVVNGCIDRGKTLVQVELTLSSLPFTLSGSNGRRTRFLSRRSIWPRRSCNP